MYEFEIFSFKHNYIHLMLIFNKNILVRYGIEIIYTFKTILIDKTLTI